MAIFGHIFSESQSLKMAFDGTDAEYAAVDYITRRRAIVDTATGCGNVVFWQPHDQNGQPVAVPAAMHRAMHPRCTNTHQHGSL